MALNKLTDVMRIIIKLKNHDIVKIRGQFKFEIMNGSMQFTPESEIHKTKNAFIEAERTTREEYNTAKNKNKAQKNLEENPLYGF